jgi:hypothetical protein
MAVGLSGSYVSVTCAGVVASACVCMSAVMGMWVLGKRGKDELRSTKIDGKPINNINNNDNNNNVIYTPNR